jgi:uncharacterized protein YjbI with pentapeptide repeats
MANEDQIGILRQGAEVWNKWRMDNPDEHIELRRANLSEVDLNGANLSEVNLSGANLSGGNLYKANLCEARLLGTKLIQANLIDAKLIQANLRGADLYEANLSLAKLNEANLSRADLCGANLSGADLSGVILVKADLCRAILVRANLCGANLTEAVLNGAVLVETNLERAILTGCKIYGISAWELKLDDAKQNDLVITKPDQAAITVDNLEVAQFIYLLLHNEKIRHVIDTITSKVVLILGRFTDIRKPVLDAIRDELRRRDYLPVLFDFEKSANRDIAETVSTLAHMARFIIADISDAKSIPAELEHIVPQLLSVPVMPVILKSDYEYALFERIIRFNQVLEPYQYENQEALLASVGENVIKPAEEKADELKKKLEKTRCDR